jgi:hypothetical protein
MRVLSEKVRELLNNMGGFFMTKKPTYEELKK